MKIAFITESFPARSETFILGKAVELKRRGHEVTVFTQFQREGRVHPDLEAALDFKREVVRLPVWDRVRPKDVGRALLAAGFNPGRIDAIRRRIMAAPELKRRRPLALVKSIPFARADYDLIHAHYGYMGLRWQEVMTALDRPLVVSLLGTDASIDIPRDPAAYQSLFQAAPRFIAVVDYLKRKVVECGCDPAKVEVIPTEVDAGHFRFFDRSGRKRERPVILTVGRLDWTKGYPYALEAMARLKAEGRPFVYNIVGAGRGEPEVTTAIDDFGIGDRVSLLVALDRAGVRAAMEDADVFLLASVIEGIGGVLLEAQASGLPVVATRVGGLPEVVQDGETGFLVPSRDPSALADRLSVLLRDPSLRLRMGVKGREWAAANFEAGMLMDRMLDLYARVIAEWRAR